MKLKSNVISNFKLVFADNFSELKDVLITDEKELENKEQFFKILEKYRLVKDQDLDSIKAVLKNWKLERLSLIDRSIIFFSIAKIKYLNFPPNKTISEAIELARMFSEKKSPKFINGVLDAWYNKHKKEA